MYQVFLTYQVEKECRKRGKRFREKVIEISKSLSFTPYPSQAERLSGVLHLLYSYHFNFSATAYRLAYTINEKEKKIYPSYAGLSRLAGSKQPIVPVGLEGYILEQIHLRVV